MDAVLAVGYAFTFTAFLSRFHIPPHTAMLLGASSLSYLLLATVIVFLHSILRVIDRHLIADADAGRRGPDPVALDQFLRMARNRAAVDEPAHPGQHRRVER